MTIENLKAEVTDDGYVIISGDGDNRAISPTELRKMLDSDQPVIVS